MSAKRSRKQREIEQRETDLLESARHILAERGYLGLNMDRIAEALEYSKGTIYQHFSCKEEVLLALAIQTNEKRTSMFARAAAFRGETRERITAIGAACELFVRLYPEYFHVEQVLRTSSIWDKTSSERQQLLRGCEVRCMSIVAGIIRDAISRSDLQLRPEQSPEDLAFGMWSLSFGAYSIMTSTLPLVELGISDPYRAVRTNIHLMLDGVGWKPLAGEWDFDASVERILSDVFPEEAREAFAA